MPKYMTIGRDYSTGWRTSFYDTLGDARKDNPDRIYVIAEILTRQPLEPQYAYVSTEIRR